MSYLPRPQVEEPILEAAVSRAPRLQVIQAPRGAGKTTLLRRTASLLAARGRLPVTIDIDRICTSPSAFARHFTARVEAALGTSAGSAPRARDLRRALEETASAARPDSAALVDLALSYPAALAAELHRPIVLLLDELGEVARLARHPGMRDGLPILARRLAADSPVAIVGAVSPASRPGQLLRSLAQEAGGAMRLVSLPLLSAPELAALARSWGRRIGERPGELELWVKATCGRPLYAEILTRHTPAVDDVASALAAEMAAPAGALHQECRFDYHLLVERSRGYGVVRTILELLSREEGMNLSGIARSLRISLPTALDYLSWLLEVELIRRDGRGYVFADPLLRLWVVLNGPEPVDPLEEAVRFLESPRALPVPPSRPRGRRPGAAPRQEPPPAREEVVARLPEPRDLLIEID